MSRLNDPDFVRKEYRTETGLAGRSALYRFVSPDATDPRDVALNAIVATQPTRVLEVGCGRGEFAERLMREGSVGTVAVDLSDRMVELARQRGVDALVADVQALPFSDGEFDCVAALWMLFHVPDLKRALGEIARVLRPAGRLVATTNGDLHLHELRILLGVGRDHLTFGRENGAEILRSHFSHVERHDVDDWVAVPDRQPLVEYAQASFGPRDHAWKISFDLSVPFRIRRAVSIFVAAGRARRRSGGAVACGSFTMANSL